MGEGKRPADDDGRGGAADKGAGEFAEPCGVVLGQVAGFTPVIDGVVADVGLVAAAVYSVVWRFCQLRDGVCRTRIEGIAARLGLNRRTIEHHLTVLCDGGYLRKLPRPGLTDIYQDIGRMVIENRIEARPSGQGDIRQKVATGTTESRMGPARAARVANGSAGELRLKACSVADALP